MTRSQLAGCCLWFALAAAPATADDDGITVVGVGEARGKPDALEFHAWVLGSGELANDALTKYQECKRRALAAVEQLQHKEIKVSVGAMSLMQQGNQNQKMEVALSSLLRVTLHDISAMPEEKVFELATQLVDKLKDASVPIGATQMGVDYVDADAEEAYGLPLLARFVLDDAAELREEARRRAFEAARANAEKLAALADLRLGAVEAIRETASETHVDAEVWQAIDYVVAGGAQLARAPTPSSKLRLTSRTFAEIPVRVSLQVRFRTRSKLDDGKTADVKPPGKEE